MPEPVPGESSINVPARPPASGLQPPPPPPPTKTDAPNGPKKPKKPKLRVTESEHDIPGTHGLGLQLQPAPPLNTGPITGNPGVIPGYGKRPNPYPVIPNQPNQPHPVQYLPPAPDAVLLGYPTPGQSQNPFPYRPRPGQDLYPAPEPVTGNPEAGAASAKQHRPEGGR